jgi:hypothetical protein
MKNIRIGEMTISEAYPHLKYIADKYDLNLKKVREFRMVRLILANLYSNQH